MDGRTPLGQEWQGHLLLVILPIGSSWWQRALYTLFGQQSIGTRVPSGLAPRAPPYLPLTIFVNGMQVMVFRSEIAELRCRNELRCRKIDYYV